MISIIINQSYLVMCLTYLHNVYFFIKKKNTSFAILSVSLDLIAFDILFILILLSFFRRTCIQRDRQCETKEEDVRI